ncbi:Helix-turn-helix domain-containing protein [Corynebacterium coyleae]|uniref:IS481 family transposase n=1 Tax=Corynebacterium coyleae TaxID=53374 RepID=A0ABX8KU26_9CORY|nr:MULTISPECIES: IS481 family transposase [Corynebacterium]OFO33850.1 integrase [Corynebacterium sp. HMSC075D04]PLA36848.1 IS481 family transposase [Corynebacterium coyleae]QXB18186.1 IS481 family transposase [Corynebacterium coyleae]QXB19407.1 IS481 family transposase [Corynebacterium coyleae]WJY78685.1 Integrase core domain protein [Corynebacterium coyleae]
MEKPGKPTPKIIIQTMLATGMSQAEAAEHFGVSTRWIRTLQKRYREGGMDALTPRSKRPRTNPRALDKTVVDRILQLRDELTHRGTDAGAHTIRWHLQQDGIDPPPAVSTIHRVLANNGRITPQPQKRPRSSWRRFQADQPNETWQMDYSDWTIAGHKRVAILTILDDHSRFIISCRAYHTATVTNVITSFIAAVQVHGCPQSTLTDNGRAFTTNTDRKNPSRNGFEQLLIDLGITQKNGKPYHPQTQGKVERFHHTLKLALNNKPPAQTIEELNEDINEIIDYYNYKRPHRALARITPAEAYSALPKAKPAAANFDHHYRLRTDKVSINGKTTLRWGGKLRRLYIGRRWGGEPITMVCVDNHVDIKINATGAQIAAYTLTDEKIYYNQSDNELNPKRGNSKNKNLETP